MPKMSWEDAVRWLREQKDKQELVRACFFDDPLLDAARRFHASEEWKAVQQMLPQMAGKALDVGAGRGIASFALAEDGWTVTALEPDPSNLVGAGAIADLARESGHLIHIVQEWGEKLPFPDASFDVVHARQVLHHASDLEKFCLELARVLKPGGLFIATREHVIDSPDELEIFRANHDLHRLYGGECAFSLEHYLDAISHSGMLFVQILAPFSTPINYFPATNENVLNMAKEAWNWDFPMGEKIMIAQLNRTATYPGRLYTFVARRPAATPEDTVSILRSRVVMLEAKLDAREVAMKKGMEAMQNRIDKKTAVSDARIERLEANMAVRFSNRLHHFLKRLIKRA